MDTPFPNDGTRHLDQQVHAALARATASLSPASAALALLDWSAHLASSPSRQIELAAPALRHAEEFARYVRESGFAGALRPCKDLRR
jgi:polyhydroxyalkanoate synthase